MYRVLYMPFAALHQRDATLAFLRDNDIQLPLEFGELLVTGRSIFYRKMMTVANTAGRVRAPVLCEVEMVRSPLLYPDLVYVHVPNVNVKATLERWKQKVGVR